MKRIFILILFLFLSGCTVNYNFSYVEENIKEEFTVNTKTNEMCGNQLCRTYIDNYASNEISVYYDSNNIIEGYIYQKSIFNYNDDYSLKLNYDYIDKKQFSTSFLAKSLFNNVIITDEKIIAYDTKDIFKNYLYLDKITVEFTTDKLISKSNCDEIINDKYYWYIDKENYNTKTINIYFDSDSIKKENEKIVEDGYITGNILEYILYVLGLFVIITFIYIFIKYKKTSR